MTRSLIRCSQAWFCAGLLVASFACSEPSPPGGDPDASVAEAGIEFAFVAEHFFPESFDTNDYTVDVQLASFTIANLRLIGDAATGDERTSLDIVTLEWKSDEPIEVMFPDAPPGIYSRVRGTLIRFELHGDVQIPGDGEYPYEIEENSSITIEMEIDATLESGMPLSLPVTVNLKKMSDAFWKGQLENDGGEIEVEVNLNSETEEAVADSFKIND